MSGVGIVGAVALLCCAMLCVLVLLPSSPWPLPGDSCV